MVDPEHRQGGHRVRFEWGPTGGAAIAAGADVAVVVDVLSFTTTLCVAVERGVSVLPYGWKDGRAGEYAVANDATLAVGRLEARDSAGHSVSLSPAAMQAVEEVERVVLPSPNGSAISFALADTGAVVVGACLRNRTAVADWLGQRSGTVAVVAAGERWPDGSLRPAVEDLWGAGAVLAALVDAEPDLGEEGLSPEARVAERAFRAVEAGLGPALARCASGRELAAAGFGEDLTLAGELDVSAVVPVLRGSAFGPASN